MTETKSAFVSLDSRVFNDKGQQGPGAPCPSLWQWVHRQQQCQIKDKIDSRALHSVPVCVCVFTPHYAVCNMDVRGDGYSFSMTVAVEERGVMSC